MLFVVFERSSWFMSFIVFQGSVDPIEMGGLKVRICGVEDTMWVRTMTAV